jgi:Ca2+-binding RTX toxin-like protein
VYSAIASYTMTANVEDLLLDGTASLDGTGNALNNRIVGNTRGNNLSGGDGDDTLLGMEGDDTLSGGSGGTDHLYGGIGNDTFIIRDTLDVVHESANAGVDTVVATVSYALGANVENLTLAIGGYGTGNAQVNTITGNAGANTLDGQGGADTLVGLRGDDTYVVDNSGDIVTEVAGEGFDAIVSSVSYALAANTSVEALHTTYAAGTSAINLTGNNLANTVVGNNGSNVINGGAANDTLTGGAGQDFFLFNTVLGVGLNSDTITDFNVGDDTFQLENAIFTTLTTGNLTSAAFRIGSAAQDADDRIIYNGQTGAVLYDFDGSGAGAAVQFATVGTGLALTTADFLVI